MTLQCHTRFSPNDPVFLNSPSVLLMFIQYGTVCFFEVFLGWGCTVQEYSWDSLCVNLNKGQAGAEFPDDKKHNYSLLLNPNSTPLHEPT